MRARGYMMLGHAADHEIEALQTDIMRFFAIVALCLMVIFSLVQSIPMEAEAGHDHELISETSQQKTLDQLIERVKLLEKENRELQFDLNQREREMVDQRSKFNEMEALLSAAREHAVKAGRQATQVQQALQQARYDQIKVQKELNLAQKHLKSAVERQNQLREMMGEKGKSAADDAAGHTFGFDKHALSSLAQQGMVRFYMDVGGKKLFIADRLDGAVWRYIEADKGPDQLYMMPIGEVPDSFLKGAKKTVLFDKKGVAFGVWLPATITNRVHLLMEQTQSGRIQIKSDGSVDIVQ